MKTHSWRLLATLILAAAFPLPAQNLEDFQYRESLARGGNLEGLSLYER